MRGACTVQERGVSTIPRRDLYYLRITEKAMPITIDQAPDDEPGLSVFHASLVDLAIRAKQDRLIPALLAGHERLNANSQPAIRERHCRMPSLAFECRAQLRHGR
jgi:hypothetical protein